MIWNCRWMPLLTVIKCLFYSSCLLYVDRDNWLSIGVIDYQDFGNAKQRVFDWINQLQGLVINYSDLLVKIYKYPLLFFLSRDFFYEP